MTVEIPSGVKFVLMDIEGTISDMQFVKNVLFPYSARELRNFVSQNKTNPKVRQCLADTGRSSDEEAIQQLLEWIDQDVKHPALKSLQGMIWKKGYHEGAFRSHLYADVLPKWREWKDKGFRLGIYSSGSVEAQKLFFAFTVAGDVSHYLEAHFDLNNAGPKRELASYRKIAERLELEPRRILFLSDIEAELDAAREAGMYTCHIVRDDSLPSARHPASGTL